MRNQAIKRRIDALASRIGTVPPISVSEFHRREARLVVYEVALGLNPRIEEIYCNDAPCTGTSDDAVRRLSNEQLHAMLYPSLLEREAALGLWPIRPDEDYDRAVLAAGRRSGGVRETCKREFARLAEPALRHEVASKGLYAKRAAELLKKWRRVSRETGAERRPLEGEPS